MTTETERRFILDPTFALALLVEKPMLGVKQVQGYITADEKRTARVRVESPAQYVGGDIRYAYSSPQSFFTLKGKKDESGKGMEVEGEIPNSLATSLLAAAVGSVSKVRFTFLREKTRTVTVDVFEGANRGLVIMEVEGSDEAVASFLPPSYAKEITTLHQYSCSQLALKPYSEWTEREKVL